MTEDLRDGIDRALGEGPYIQKGTHLADADAGSDSDTEFEDEDDPILANLRYSEMTSPASTKAKTTARGKGGPRRDYRKTTGTPVRGNARVNKSATARTRTPIELFDERGVKRQNPFAADGPAKKKPKLQP